MTALGLLVIGVAVLVATTLATYTYFGGYWHMLRELEEKNADQN